MSDVGLLVMTCIHSSPKSKPVVFGRQQEDKSDVTKGVAYLQTINSFIFEQLAEKQRPVLIRSGMPPAILKNCIYTANNKVSEFLMANQ